MHPVLLTLSGTFLKFLCILALFATPLMLALRKRKRFSPDDLALFFWCLLLASVGFVLGSPTASQRGFALAVTHWSAFAEPWTALPIYSYGVLLALALIAGARLGLRFSRKMLMPDRDYALWAASTSVAALVGARLLYVIVQWKLEFVSRTTGLILWDKLLIPRANGFVVYGGLLLGTLWTALFCALRRYSIWRVSDMGTITVALGLMIGRTGCFLAGCDFGRPLSVDAPAWLARAGSFPRWPDHRGSPAWWQHVMSGFRSTAARCHEVGGRYQNDLCFLSDSDTHSVAVHPTQLYELCVGLALLLLQVWLWPRRRFDGQVALTFMILYGLLRSMLEVVRDDIERGHTLGLTTSQWIGLSTSVVGCVLYAVRWHSGQRPLFNMRTS
jgi:phosphatidylglycerol:prolipoprotein diacylglycerol transferase